jgi:hypothetical protein
VRDSQSRILICYCGVYRLYHVRGNDESKKRKLARNVPAMVRSKLYKFRLVLYHKEALEKVRLDHSTHHDGHCTAETRLNHRYFIKDLRKKVQAVGGSNCSVCASHEPVKKKPTVPILTSRRGQLVMFDLTKFYVAVRAFVGIFCMQIYDTMGAHTVCGNVRE